MKCISCGNELTTGDVDRFMCNSCKNLKEAFSKPSLYGWICPRCGKVHSPFSTHCDCPPPLMTYSGTTTDILNK